MQNPLATEKVGKLLIKFAVPAVMSFLVNALYNIVDQIFIGQGVGMLGNAATNVAFPLTTICTATALLLGVGSASNFNLEMGAGRKEEAGKIAGCGISLMAVSGILIAVLTGLFLTPLMKAFGATEQVFPLAATYTGITLFGFPFVIFSTGCSQLIRADGSPTYSMICIMSGAILNTILDPIFIFVFNMGIAGAALATVIGQILSALLAIRYLFRFKACKLTPKCLKPSWYYAKKITALGSAACFNQLTMTVVQIAMNNVLTYYGARSLYGSDIPLACVGVISKVNIILIGFFVGIAQGCQPICGFNYGAKNYSRVKETYQKASITTLVIGIAVFICFQLFPRQIISIFGKGSEEYFLFGERYFRIFMFMTFANGIQPLTSNFFTSIGKARHGMLISLTRQIIFLLPFILIFPIFMGIDGVMYAGPIADGISALLAIILVVGEIRKWNTI